MSFGLLERRYGHGAAQVRLSIPSFPVDATPSLRESAGLAFAEAGEAGWRRNTIRLTAGAGALALLLLGSATALRWERALFEPTEILLVRAEPAVPPAPPKPAEPPPPAPQVATARPVPPEVPEASPVSVEVTSVEVAAASRPPQPVTTRAPLRPDAVAPVAAPRRALALSAPAVAIRVPSRPAPTSRAGSLFDDAPVPDVAASAVVLPAAARVSRSAPPAAPRGARPVTSTAARPAPLAVAPTVDRKVEGVPLDALAACDTDAEEDSLKQRLLSTVEMRKTCRGEMGSYQFLQMRNLNSFLLWVDPASGRPMLDRCDELRLALRCIRQPITGAQTR